MIEHLDIKKLRRPLDFLGQLFIHFTGLQLTRWVVMCQDNPHGKRLEYDGKKDSHIHQGSRDTTMGQWINSFDLVGAVQQYYHKSLVQSNGVSVPIIEQKSGHLIGVRNGVRFQGPKLFPVTYLYFVDFVFHDQYLES